MNEPAIKVILIEDSGFMRILISEILRRDNDIALIATAANGKDGLQKVKSMNPDVIVTDMIMPEYDGLYVVREVMNGPATPVILLSSLERKDEQIFEALKAGAFDFVEKPQARLDDDDGQPYALIPLIKAAAQSGRKTIQGSSSKNFNHHTFEKELPYDIVVIGSSTGGPSAIESILDNLPKNLAVPVVVAQHMPERFIETFAQRLNAKNILKVKIAEDGGTLDPGCVYLCPGHQNVRISRITSAAGPCFEFTSKRYREFNFPSVDCLFESVAETFAHKSVAVILTGMGKDGTEGIKKIKSAGGYTIAQDESSCVIFGMPKSAFDSGAIRQVLALPEIPGFIVSCLS